MRWRPIRHSVDGLRVRRWNVVEERLPVGAVLGWWYACRGAAGPVSRWCASVDGAGSTRLPACGPITGRALRCWSEALLCNREGTRCD